MRQITFLKIITIAIILTLFIIPVSNTFAEGEQQKNKILTVSNKVLFEISNMKPGDWAERKLTVQNRGENDFTYYSKANYKGGSEKLFNEFLFEASDSKGTLFKGKLKDFEKFQPRFLKAGHQEEIEFRIEFPYELGNEYQGLGFEYELQFFVEGNSSSPVPDNTDQRPISQEELASPPAQGKILPKTATSMFNLLAVGLILLVFGSALFLYQKRKQAH